MVSRQDAHLLYRCIKPKRHQFTDAIVRTIPFSFLAHRNRQYIITLLFDAFFASAWGNEDFQIHTHIILLL